MTFMSRVTVVFTHACKNSVIETFVGYQVR